MAFKQFLLAGAIGASFLTPETSQAENHLGANTVVATVNDIEITLGHMIVLKTRLPEQYQNLPHDTLFEGILDQLVQQTLLGQSVETLSKGSQLTLDNEERALRAQEAIHSVTLNAATDEALRNAYDEAIASRENEQEYNASHILVETEEEAQALVTMLDGGADFAELAKEKSTGPSGPNGGSLGWFGKGRMVPEFENAVIDMKVGSVSNPIQTQFGWHVIKLNESRQVPAPTIEELRSELGNQLRRTAIEAKVAELTKAGSVTRISPSEIAPELLDDFSLIEN